MILTVPTHAETARLDRFLRDYLPALPRGGMFAALRKGKIHVNGTAVRDGKVTVRPGDTVEILGFEPGPDSGRSVRMGAEILYEDDLILAVNKPKGFSVHEGDTGEHEITVLAMLESYGRSRGFTPQLVHRLDKYTSGVLIAAKTKRGAVELGLIFKRKDPDEIRKFYTAVVFGFPSGNGTITTPLDGKRAVTSYVTVSGRPWGRTRINLLELEIVTGRTHQIRRHLAERGTPVAGDDMYGSWEFNRLFKREFGYRDYALHCRRIELRHPVTGTMIVIEAPVPREMLRLVEKP